MIIRAKKCDNSDCNAINEKSKTYCFNCGKYLGEYGERGIYDAGYCTTCKRWIGYGQDGCYTCNAIAPWKGSYYLHQDSTESQRQRNSENSSSSNSSNTKKKKKKGWW